jgi:hypothetical protein
MNLLRILNISGCSLGLHDKIIDWVCHYSLVANASGWGQDFWVQSNFKKKDTLVSHLSEVFDTAKHCPHLKQVICDFDWRKIDVPVFFFVAQVMSLLHDPTVMSSENIIKGYDVLTVNSCAGKFWKHCSLSDMNPQAVPVPYDLHRRIGDIECCTTFQQALDRLCTNKKTHASADCVLLRQGNLRSKWFTCVLRVDVYSYFCRYPRCHLSSLWRVIGYTPNLNVGRGQPNKKNGRHETKRTPQVLERIIARISNHHRKGRSEDKHSGQSFCSRVFFSTLMATLKDTTTYVVTFRGVQN